MRFWPPLGKFLLAVALLIVSLVATSPIVPLAVFVVGMALLFRSTRFRFPKVIRMALLDALIIFLFGTLIIALVTAEGSTIWSATFAGISLRITDAGLNLAMMVFLRALAGVSVMLFFATSTPIPHFACALRQMRIPRYIIELVILVYRYSFLLFEQLEVMYVAANCRLGFRGTRNKLRTTGKLAVGLFIRSLEVADRSQIALYCRNFKGDFPSFRPPARMTAFWTLLPLVAFLSLYLLNHVVVNWPLNGWW
ncbi:MAG: cobalt ECF transporter T component CbiQ [Methanomassiliicoccales archaeon]|nr:cobalt ECF transporter T component CbiQ [Methanomassiliicoccales archaeon]